MSLLFYSDYSSDETILHLWEWSQHDPEEAGLVFFKLKFSCDCLLKCPCFACEEKLIYVDLSSQNINSTTVVVYKLQAELALRPGLMLLPQVLLLVSYLPGSCAHWQWTAHTKNCETELQLSYIRFKKSILFLFYSFIISVVGLMRDLETRVQSLHFNTKSTFSTVIYGWNQQETVSQTSVCQFAWLKYSLYFGPSEGKSEVVFLTKPSSSVS